MRARAYLMKYFGIIMRLVSVQRYSGVHTRVYTYSSKHLLDVNSSPCSERVFRVSANDAVSALHRPAEGVHNNAQGDLLNSLAVLTGGLRVQSIVNL